MSAVLSVYLPSISNFLKTHDEGQLKQYLRVEPPLPDHFAALRQELATSYQDSDVLEALIEKLIPYNEDESPEQGGAWPGFLAFMKLYLEYIRDVNFEDLLGTYEHLTAVLNACITAFSHNMHGLMLLSTTIQISAALGRLARTLDERPDLTSHLKIRVNYEAGEATASSPSTAAAEVIQRAFTICLTERGSSSNGILDGKPEGKKIGIYSFANLVLKLFFQCRKTSGATQLLTNVLQSSPRLSAYPASQRVTYLFYLGRFHFFNTHFLPASLALQGAYDQCHARCINQRRSILIYLAATNTILGRFPTANICSRPEAVGVLDRFIPICHAIKLGDFITFHRLMARDSDNYDWFWRHKIYLPLLKRCELGLWRSLARRVFLLTYQEPTDRESKKAPVLFIPHLVTAAQYCQKVMEGYTRQRPGGSLQPPASGRNKLHRWSGVYGGNMMPDILLVEMTVANLVSQNFLHGFLSHNQSKFAIIGAKSRGGPLSAGFPSLWSVVVANAEENADDVPGWVQEDRVLGGGGRVVKLTSAKAVGT